MPDELLGEEHAVLHVHVAVRHAVHEEEVLHVPVGRQQTGHSITLDSVLQSYVVEDN